MEEELINPKTQTIDNFLSERGFLLHHSKTSEIPIGAKIRSATLSSEQVTASDAVPGFSYAWDAQTGVRDSVMNQVSMRGFGGINDPTSSSYGKPYAHTVYLTQADPSAIYPDVNVPATAARGIKGADAQTVLDRVSIPANISDDEAIDLVQQMVDRAGVSRLSQEDQIAKNYAYAISDRGPLALADFEEGQGERYLHLQRGAMQRKLDLFIKDGVSIEGNFLQEELEAVAKGPESLDELYLNRAAKKLGKESATAGDIVRSGIFGSFEDRGEKLSAVISHVKGTPAEEFVGRKLEDIPLNALRSSLSKRMLKAADSASAAVAGGTSNSAALRAAGTILNILT